MIILKKDIINIIQLFIELKEHNIQEFMGIIHLKNFSYMINQKFIVQIIKLVSELLNQLQLLFLVMVDMFLQIDFNIIWIILKILISILIKLIIYLIIWLEYQITRDMSQKVLPILKVIKDLIAFRQKGKISHNLIYLVCSNNDL